ncbi:hypothetical protein MMC10_009315 [Thelotrema lepadinum]|nr:hypothetical protein [Thelotrema lepadinum]
MAELATGMMIICFPTLPSLLQHVKRQPSRSQPSRSLLEIAQSARYTNNSERYYELDQSRVTGIGQQSVEAGHIELPGVDRPFAGACGQTGQIVNNIQGGRPLQEPFWSALPKDPVSGRKILKTVTVEQMRS